MISRYQINDREYLELSDDALKVFSAHVQAFGQNEAGGILLGSIYPGFRVVIEKATAPYYPDRAGPCYFDRSRKRAQRIVEREWENSSGIRIYLGEWHTHPELHPTPSARDYKMISNMLRQTKMQIDFLFLIIVGIHSTWVGLKNGERMRQLDRCLIE
jgi:integrative and conjugative element protein (TIGR02256 family)